MTSDDRMSYSQFQCGKECRASDSIDNITSAACDKIKCKALNWKGLDTFNYVDWELGPRGKHLHSNCRIDTPKVWKIE